MEPFDDQKCDKTILETENLKISLAEIPTLESAGRDDFMQGQIWRSVDKPRKDAP